MSSLNLIFPLGLREIHAKKQKAFELPWKNLYDLVPQNAAYFPDKVAIEDDERSVTYSQFLEEVDQLSTYLRGHLDVHTGDHIGLLMVNSIEFCTAFFALARLGAVSVTLSTKLQTSELEAQIGDAGIKALVTDDLWLNKIPPGMKRDCILVRESAGKHCSKYATFREAVAVRKIDAPPVPEDDQLPAVIMYTSGTTGHAKGAVLTHFNLLQAAYSYKYEYGLDENERTVLSIPAFHITGLNCVMVLFVMLGAYQRLMPFFQANTVLKMLEKTKATHIHAVPTVYIMLTTAFQGEDLSTLRSALCGGGFIPYESAKKFTQIAPYAHFYPVYGMTETAGAGTCFLLDYMHCGLTDSAGIAIPNCEVGIFDEAMQKLSPGKVGEICFRGAVVSPCYLHNNQNDNFYAGWLRSGDIGYINQEGYIFIKDRIKDMINRGGEKIFSLEVEDAILQIPGIRQAAVFAAPDEIYGEIPVAVVVREASGPTADMILQALSATIAHYKIPHKILFRESLPLTGSNKVRKNLLKQEVLKSYGILQ